MNIQIVGANGFVGSNLARQFEGAELYFRNNLNQICYSSADLTIFAAAPAEKWKANLNPEEDLKNLENLAHAIKQIRTKKFVLISTIDVFPPNFSGNESDFPCNPPTSYGKNRLWLENFVSENFESPFIVRLPGLFGPGLKKNLIFDVVNNLELKNVDPNASYEWYDIRNLKEHLLNSLEANISLAHFATEPIRNQILFEELFPEKLSFLEFTTGESHKYCFETIHAMKISNNSGNFIESANSVIANMREWLTNEHKL